MLGIALLDLFDELARDHEGDAPLRGVWPFHRVLVAKARHAAEVPAPTCALDRVVGERVRGDRLLACSFQYSLASMIVRMRVVFCELAGSSEPNSACSSK